MSTTELQTIQVLADSTTKRLFKIVVGSRLLSRYEIESKEDDVPKEQVTVALGKLEEAGLIEKRSSAIEEFDKFYPTASGLRFEKMF